MSSRFLLLTIVMLAVISVHYFFLPLGSILAESDDRVAKIKGNVVNSKYVTITNHRYQHNNLSDIITGTLINNSTQGIPVISIIAVLYDKDNKLITTGISAADASDLPGGHGSRFSIDLYNLGNNEVDHYILFPGGIP